MFIKSKTIYIIFKINLHLSDFLPCHKISTSCLQWAWPSFPINYYATFFLCYNHTLTYTYKKVLSPHHASKKFNTFFYIQLSWSRLEFASSSGRKRNSLRVEVTIDWLGLIRPTLIGCVDIFTDGPDAWFCWSCWFIGLPKGDEVKTDDDAVHVVVTLLLLLRPNVA